MAEETQQAADAAAIRELVEGRVKAIRVKNVEGATANYAPDVLIFDVINPLRRSGSEAARQRAKEWFGSFQGTLDFEIRDLGITTGGDVAFSHGLNQVKGKRKDGEPIEMWWRTTSCYRRMEGVWIITHEHSSVPFNPLNGKASLGLKP